MNDINRKSYEATDITLHICIKNKPWKNKKRLTKIEKITKINQSINHSKPIR